MEPNVKANTRRDCVTLYNETDFSKHMESVASKIKKQLLIKV